MLTVQPTCPSQRTRSLNVMAPMADIDHDDDSDDSDGGKGGKNKSRRELPAGAVATLKAWLLSPEHFTHPYPTPQDQVMLMQTTGIDKKQLKNWFTNARRRIWKPMLKKQLEQGKLASTGPGGVVAVPGTVQGMMMSGLAPGMDGQMQYQQAMQGGQGSEMQQQIQVDQYGNSLYGQQAQMAHAPQPASLSQSQYYDPNTVASISLPMTNSIGSLAQLGNSGSGNHLSKTDSHAVLMELFARDQDLVRQATESAGFKKPQDLQTDSSPAGQSYAESSGQPQLPSSQHPINSTRGRLGNVPTLNSWPHFSSVSSLNNLGTMPGVKSITSLSGADLAKQGGVNSFGNLAQVKSFESMGKNDSYAFLEVFFGDRSSGNLNQMGSKDSQRGIKREREEDNDVGLMLDDECPSASNIKKESSNGLHQPSVMTSSLFNSDNDISESSDTLKQAFDAAVAARGLMSVSRSSEKLTDLALPAKMQRSLSQEFMRQQQQPQQQEQQYKQYQYSATPAAPDQTSLSPEQSQQYPGQHPTQSEQCGTSSHSSGPSYSNNSVEVPSATKCAICNQTNVDTQLRPCGHMFHERCLKPSLQGQMGPPRCPIDHIPMQSALLAVPTDENATPWPVQPPTHSWSPSDPACASQTVSTDPRR